MRIEFDDGNTLAASILGAALMRYAEEMTGTSTTVVDDETGTATRVIGSTSPDVPEHEITGNEQASRPAEPIPPVAPAEPATDTPRDRKGVAFNPDFCGVAKEPFYGKGPREGQWKKLRGLDDAKYDAWYAGELGAEDTPQVDTAAVLAPQAPAGAPPPPPEEPGTLSDFSAFVIWSSENKQAGRITDAHEQEAFKAVGVTYNDLVMPDSPAQLADNMRHIVAFLVAAGAQAPE